MNSSTVFTIAIPTMAVLFGVLLNRHDATSIRVEMGSLRQEMKAAFNQLRSEMIQLRDSIHRDMIGIHERVAVMEAKQGQ
jgi:hypothetical protein